MSKKQVKCRDCGFLTIYAVKRTKPIKLAQASYLGQAGLLGGIELIEEGRRKIADGIHFDVSKLGCAKSKWTELDPGDIDAAFAFLKLERDCTQFFPYHPGYSPGEHKELERDERAQTTLRKGMLLAAAIGAGATLITALVTGIVAWLIAR